jgi:predicted dehydrogenase
MTVKWGILSTAHINRLFLAGARQSPNLEIIAVASRDGDEGTLRLTDPWHCRRAGIDVIRGERNETERIEVERADSYRLEAENMSAAIRGEAPLLLGRDDAVGQAKAIEALYAAADAGRGVTLA